MNELRNSLKGYKTYLTAIVIGGIAAAEVLGYHIPNKEAVLTILASLGLIFLRAGNKQ